MKVFLSHSSADKHLVKQVAEELGRARVWFDQMHIETAADLSDALRRALEEADLFVLFASSKSLQSDWVRWEATIAERLFIARKLDSIAAFLIEEDISYKLLPEIFHKIRAEASASPKYISAEILRIIQQNNSAARQALFVGRQKEVAEAEKMLVDFTKQRVPSTFIVFGLEGSGRRTLASQVSKNVLGLSTRRDIACRLGDGPAEVITDIQNKLDVLSTDSELEDQYGKLLQDEHNKLIQYMCDLIHAACERKVLLCLVDLGGLLDDEGLLLTWLRDVTAAVEGNGRGQFAIISRRRPLLGDGASEIFVPQMRLPPLSDPDSQALVRALLRYNGVPVTNEQVRDIAALVYGFPPAAYYAVQLIVRDGVEITLANSCAIERITEARFLRVLEEDDKLSDERRVIMSLLSQYSPLTLRIISDYVDITSEQVHEALSYLLDTCLVYP